MNCMLLNKSSQASSVCQSNGWRYLRPAEVDKVADDATKARHVLQWQSRASFRELVRIMVNADLAALRANASQIQ